MSNQSNLKEYGILLSAIEVHGKEFSSRMRGYDADEVNHFLDQIIKDYQAFEHVIADLEKENKELKHKLNQSAPSAAPVSLSAAVPGSGQSQQLEDLLNRVRDLEFHCWGRTKG
ncbi:DivIVA domain-containing protein [Paenibacillus agilis]|uniref:DivIVA domain-containing protein n=1 Tax=Paenibacillus agilis TaxID=3020863 RepID=A0A559IHS9_9BACL|nr:DivIVA domain-containing protein [Paenibacillus agilis]TVX87171.1 DivIVA domain-containing protein [Paenibacillus agilis]